MKKVLSAVLALAMVFSLSCTAFAVEEVPYEPVATEETNIVPKSSLSLSFTSLGSGSRKTSSETYYISGEDAVLTINSSGVPDGDYKVCIVNGGSKSITGAMQYEVK